MNGFSPLLVVLVSLLLLATVFASLDYQSVNAQLMEARVYRLFDRRSEMYHTAIAVLEQLNADSDPATDTEEDRVFQMIEADENLSLNDVSSRFSMNLVRRQFLDSEEMQPALLPGSNGLDIQQYREDFGFFSNILYGYGDFVNPDTYESFFTESTYANVNSDGEFALRILYEQLTGDQFAADQFHSRIQEALQQQRRFSAGDLDLLLSPYSEELREYMNTMPKINVNYAPEQVLSVLLDYPLFDIPYPETALQSILSAAGGIHSIGQLASMLNVPEDHRIFDHIGFQTQLRQLIVHRGNLNLRVNFKRRFNGEDGGVGNAAAFPASRVSQTEETWYIVSYAYFEDI